MAQKTSPKVEENQETTKVEKKETKVTVRFLEDYKNGNIANHYFRAGNVVEIEPYKVPQILADRQGVNEIDKKEA